MRYHSTTWNDISLALEAFRYARRALLAICALTLPFAIWAEVSPGRAEAKVEAPAAKVVAHAQGPTVIVVRVPVAN